MFPMLCRDAMDILEFAQNRFDSLDLDGIGGKWDGRRRSSLLSRQFKWEFGRGREQLQQSLDALGKVNDTLDGIILPTPKYSGATFSPTPTPGPPSAEGGDLPHSRDDVRPAYSATSAGRGGDISGDYSREGQEDIQVQASTTPVRSVFHQIHSYALGVLDKLVGVSQITQELEASFKSLRLWGEILEGDLALDILLDEDIAFASLRPLVESLLAVFADILLCESMYTRWRIAGNFR